MHYRFILILGIFISFLSMDAIAVKKKKKPVVKKSEKELKLERQRANELRSETDKVRNGIIAALKVEMQIFIRGIHGKQVFTDNKGKIVSGEMPSSAKFIEVYSSWIHSEVRSRVEAALTRSFEELTGDIYKLFMHEAVLLAAQKQYEKDIAELNMGRLKPDKMGENIAGEIASVISVPIAKRRIVKKQGQKKGIRRYFNFLLGPGCN